jgi:hypothetical protein
MKTLLRWIAFPIVFIIGTGLTTLLSFLYFDWILPLESSKDWIALFFTFPAGVILIFGQVITAVIAATVSPNYKVACYLMLLWYIFTIVLQFFISPEGFSPKGLDQKLNTIETVIGFFYSIYMIYEVNKNNSEK